MTDMIKRILVPLDGSQYAESVLPTAAYLAKRLAASVVIIHVVEKNARPEVHGQQHLTDAKQAAAYLDSIGKKFTTDAIAVEKHVHDVEVTDVAQAIAQHIIELSSDLILICTHGKRDAKEWAFGSIAQQVVSLDKAPVLIIRPEIKKNHPEFSIDKMLVPIEGKDEHSQGLRYMRDLAHSLHSSIQLLHVVDTFESVTGDWTSVTRQLPGATRHLLDMEEEAINKYLADKKRSLEQLGLSVSYAVRRGEPSGQICTEAKRVSAGLIILGTHGKKGMDAFWAGSVAAKICQKCSIPLLLVPE
jgi:nucleotide-binding universal stress UspA family protein